MILSTINSPSKAKDVYGVLLMILSAAIAASSNKTNAHGNFVPLSLHKIPVIGDVITKREN